MKGVIGRIIDIGGAALFIGLILRYNKEAVAFVQQAGSTTTQVYKAVSLQDAGTTSKTANG